MNNNKKIKIPETSLNLLKKSISHNYINVNKNLNFGIENQFDIKRVMDRYNDLLKTFSIESLKNKKILEIGSGSGIFVAYLRKEGVKAYGVEPDKYSLECSLNILRVNNIKPCISNSCGEKLKFPSNYFDIIISYQVLEHTQDPPKVLEECSRVLKKNGFLYFVVPNYNSFWEGHYSIIWFPFLPKSLYKIYVRILGRNPGFIDTLQFVTPPKLKIWAKNANLITLSYGENRFKYNLSKTKFKDYWAANPNFVKIINLFRKLRITSILSYLLIKSKTYYPIYFIAKKM